MPEKIIAKLKKSIPVQWKICFFSALIMGLVAHLYKITNWLPNWDSLVFRYDEQNMLAMGRWFLPVACAPTSFYDLPFVTGLLAILYHALGAVCICKMFSVKKSITGALIGAIITSFPAVTSVMMYNYVADGYALAFLLSCLAAMMLTKDKPCYIASTIFITLSAGIYQAYITVTIMLLIMALIFELLYKKADLKKTIFKSFRFLLTGIAGMVLYYLVLNLLLKLTGTTLLEYQGFDSAASLEGINIATSLYVIKESFLDYFFDFSTGVNAFCVINCVVFTLTLILYATDLFKSKSISKSLITLLFAALLPIGASVLAFINCNIDYHNLMKMGFMVFYLFLILQYEKDGRSVKSTSVKSWAILSVVAILIFNQVIIANVSYHKLNMAYEKSYGALIRIADRIEQNEDAADCEKILVIGALPGSEAYETSLPLAMTGSTDSYILRADDEMVGQSVLCSALNDYCEKNYSFVSGKEKSDLLNKIDIDSIDNWPDENSVSVIDDIIIIKLGDER